MRTGSFFHERSSLKEVLKHSIMLVLWFAVLTTFFATQSALLHHATQANMHVFGPMTASVGPIHTAERGDHARL